MKTQVLDRFSIQRVALLALTTFFVGAPSGCLGCGGETPPDESFLPASGTPAAFSSAFYSERLRAEFPERARVILDAEEIFVTGAREDAYVRGLPQPGDANWGGLGVELPRAADRPMRISLPSGFSFHVREVGRDGEATPAD